MTPKTDETATSGTLPPELNPLLNPKLNRNLGRWAEVYVTNPPEKRDQAVLNLLRELDSETPEASQPSPADKIERRISNANAVICSDCGFTNEADHKFCGECGAPLGASRIAIPIVADSPEAAAASKPAGAAEIGTDSRPSESVEPVVPHFGSILHLTDPAPRPISIESGDAAEASLVFGEYAESAPLKRSHRAYIGTGLAVIIGALAYLAWRGAQSTPERAILPAPGPPAATQPASPPVPAVGAPSSTEESTSSKTSDATPPPTAPEPKTQPQNVPKEEPAVETAVKSQSRTDLSGNGSQELATAQNLLSAVGKERDSATAAQWLWKAVQKQNTAATVLLAGLYLRGDGVQKNCDQGRILLDAAAAKGNKEAADLLRNLQAFGCE